jgi:hypothetical protein
LQALASLAGLPSRQADDAELDQQMYFVALAGVTRYALSEAVTAVIRGALGHTFFPTAIELRQQCDVAMEPHYREQRRIAIREEQQNFNSEFDRINARRTPEARARVAAAYSDFCRSYEKQAEEETFKLDPELVALVQDNPKALNRQRIGKDAA